MAEKKKLVTKDMSIGEVIEKWPSTAPIFAEHGMQCVGCAVAMFETIEQGAKAHDMDLEKLMKDLNETAKKKEEK